MSTMLGFDCASVNSPTLVQQHINSGRYKFAIGKASEGLHWNDPMMATYRKWAVAKGMLWGAYHYLWASEDGAAQADHFIAQAALKGGDLGMLDAEKMDDGASWAKRVAVIIAFAQRFKQRLGVWPLLYLNHYWIAELKAASTATQWRILLSMPLALADYSRTPGKFAPVPWSVVTDEQWTDNDNGLDGDWFNGDARTWAALAVPGASSTSNLKRMLVALGAVVVVGGGGVAVGSGTSTNYSPVPPALHSSTTPARPVQPRPTPTAVRPAPAPKPPVVCATPTRPRTPVSVAPRPVYVTVRAGDSLWVIAQRNHTTVAALVRLNHPANPALIYPGERVRVR